METKTTGTSWPTAISRRQIFDIWFRQKPSKSFSKFKEIKVKVLSLFSIAEEEFKSESVIKLEKDVKTLCENFAVRWKKSCRIKDKFLSKNADWLNGDIKYLKKWKKNETPSTSKHKGRPKKLFIESSERVKSRKVNDILGFCSDADQLLGATQKATKECGRKYLAMLLKECQKSPNTAKLILEAYPKQKKHHSMTYTEDEALSILVENKLTKRQYMNLRLSAKDKLNLNIYPAYNRVLKAKERCYPEEKDIIVSEDLIEIRLQALLDHTSGRIVESQKNVISAFSEHELQNLILISKWGLDGSSGHSEYKQKMVTEFSDADAFAVSLVPIQLHYENKDKVKKIFWQNPRPSSVRYCRPIRVHYKKESTELIKREHIYIESQISKLTSTKVNTLSITHDLSMTMIDGKAANAITDNDSAQTCNLCGAKPSEMNQLDKLKKKTVNESNLKYGCSSLHAWIRFLEYFLHLSYKIGIQKWQARGEQDKAKVREKKAEIQKMFKRELGLNIDKVRPGGAGTSNDGNTARRFFANYEKSAQILNLNESLLRRAAVILQTIASEYEIDSTKFETFAMKTGELLIKEYSWYYMPASIHKLLFHGHLIIKEAILPIGQMSEEAQESRNKDLKEYRENFTRKMSRLDTNRDLLNRLLITSDPYITGLRRLPKKSANTSFFPQTLEMLIEPKVDEQSNLAIREFVEEEN